jgi:glutaredoxin 3
MPAQVEIYTRAFCPFCTRALRLLDQKGVAYRQIDATMNANVKQEMMDKTGGKTFPQIIIDGQPVGGCDDLMALDKANKLDALLAGSDPQDKNSSGEDA